MEEIKLMTDEQRSIYFMQKFRQYKANEEYSKINCVLQYPSWCSTCWGRQSYTSIGGICIDQILYDYYRQTGVSLYTNKLQIRVSDWKNIYTV